MKRFLLTGIIVTLAATAVIARFTLPPPSLAEERPAQKAVTIQRGTVMTTVKATGHLESLRGVSLGFEASGTVTEVLVTRGQKVRAGDPLAKLDTTDLELAVQKAQVELDRANAALAKVKAGSNADDINRAKAGLTSAQAAYDVLMAGPNKDEVTAATADLRTAEVVLGQRQGAYDQIAWKGGAGGTSQAADLQTATIAYQKALATYNVANQGPTDDKVKAAKATIADAKATLNGLLRGATAEDIAVSEVDIQAARLSLVTAQRDLDRTILKAPWDGTLTDVSVQVGQRPGTASVMTLSDLSALHVDVPVDEIDLPAVKVDQPASVTLDALPGSPMRGRVTDIAPAPSSTTDGATTYQATVTLDKQADKVMTGMTSKVEVETERHDQVVVVAANLIAVDSTGAPYVEKLGSDGKTVQTPVTLGLRSGQVIEVREGLAEGDQVVPPAASATQQQTSATRRQGGGFMFPGGGGPPPGGPR